MKVATLFVASLAAFVTALPPSPSAPHATAIQPLPPGHVKVCSQHNFKGDCKVAILDHMVCQNFTDMNYRMQSIIQGKGSICHYYVHTQCEGKPLVNFHSINQEESRPSLNPFDRKIVSAYCFLPSNRQQASTKVRSLAPRDQRPEKPTSQLTLCSEYNFKGSCRSYDMGTSGKCVKFDVIAQSLWQIKGKFLFNPVLFEFQ